MCPWTAPAAHAADLRLRAGRAALLLEDALLQRGDLRAVGLLRGGEARAVVRAAAAVPALQVIRAVRAGARRGRRVAVLRRRLLGRRQPRRLPGVDVVPPGRNGLV